MSSFAETQPVLQYNSALLAQDVWPNGLHSVDWYPDDHEVQGIANDGKNWFFTTTSQNAVGRASGPGTMWRIPKGVVLSHNVRNEAGVVTVASDLIPDLAGGGFWHWGDPDHVSVDDVSYIIVPIRTIVACFRADNLSYVNYAFLDDRVAGNWCAIRGDSTLFASANRTAEVVEYHVDWRRLVGTNMHDAVTYDSTFILRERNGALLWMTDMQGGEFTRDGETLYLTSGRGFCVEGAPWTPQDGVHAIRTADWTEIARSVRSDDLGEPFRYNYDPTCQDCGVFFGESTDNPEGLTVWDLEDGTVPGVSGTVHVLVNRYAWSGFCDDKLYLHHFSAMLRVDGSLPDGDNGYGTASKPFHSFDEALNYYPIWNDSVIRAAPGHYDERVSIGTRVRIESAVPGRSVVVGK